MSKEVVIIFKNSGKFFATSEENYKARIINKNKVLDFSSFGSVEEVEEYFTKYIPNVVVKRG